MASRMFFSPKSAEFPSSDFPQFDLVNRRPVLAFDASTDETCYWTGIAPQGLSGAITVVVTYIMASATSGDVVLDARLEAITDADATDLDSATSFDSANLSATTAVPGTAGYMEQISITMTNDDSLAAGDYFRLSLMRDVDPNDDATGDLLVLGVELRDAA